MLITAHAPTLTRVLTAHNCIADSKHNRRTPALHGVHLEVIPNMLVCRSTDRFVLLRSELEVTTDSTEPTKFMIAPADVKTLIAALKHYRGRVNLLLGTDHIEVCIRLTPDVRVPLKDAAGFPTTTALDGLIPAAGDLADDVPVALGTDRLTLINKAATALKAPAVILTPKSSKLTRWAFVNYPEHTGAVSAYRLP